MKKTILAVLATLMMVGCSGGSTSTKEIIEVETNETVPEGGIGGDAIIIKDGNYVEYGDGTVIIYCGEGGCYTYIGSEVDESNTDVNNTSDNNSTQG